MKRNVACVAFIIGVAIFYGYWESQPTDDQSVVADLTINKKSEPSSDDAENESQIYGTAVDQNSTQPEPNRIDPNRERVEESLDYDQLKSLVDSFLNERDPETRNVLLEKLLAAMNPNNSSQISEYLKGKKLYYHERSRFNKKLGSVLGERALTEKTSSWEMRGIVEGWASTKPEQAIEWFYNLSYDEGEITQKMVANKLLDGVSQTDTFLASEVLKYVGDVDKNPWNPVTSVMKNVWAEAEQSGNSEYAKNWAEILPEGALRNFAIDQIAHRVALTDPLQAIGWLEENGNYKDRGLDMVVNAWSKHDPNGALEWLMQRNEDGVNYGRGYYHSIKGISSSDYETAVNYLDSIDNPTYKDEAMKGIAASIRVKDPAKAIDMASGIQNNRARINSVLGVVHHMYKRSPDKMYKLLAESKLSSADQSRVIKTISDRSK